MLLHIRLAVKLQNRPVHHLTVKVNHPNVAMTTAIESTRFAFSDYTSKVEFVQCI